MFFGEPCHKSVKACKWQISVMICLAKRQGLFVYGKQSSGWNRELKPMFKLRAASNPRPGRWYIMYLSEGLWLMRHYLPCGVQLLVAPDTWLTWWWLSLPLCTSQTEVLSSGSKSSWPVLWGYIPTSNPLEVMGITCVFKLHNEIFRLYLTLYLKHKFKS
jgi:hypothetical protein